jgi:hypothetical protein
MSLKRSRVWRCSQPANPTKSGYWWYCATYVATTHVLNNPSWKKIGGKTMAWNWESSPYCGTGTNGRRPLPEQQRTHSEVFAYGGSLRQVQFGRFFSPSGEGAVLCAAFSQRHEKEN